MTKTVSIIFLFLLSQSLNADTIIGFDEDNSNQQREIEKRFDSNIDLNEMDKWLKDLSGVPHHVGSIASREVAEYVASEFKSWGYEVEIESMKY